MIKAILFDLDNTLMDFALRKEKSIEASILAMQDSGLNLNYKNVEKEIYNLYDKVGIENQKIFQKFLAKHKINDYKVLAKAIYAYRKTKDAETRTYPEVKKILLKFIKKNIKLGIVSDAPKLQAYLRLVELGLEDFFDVIITADDVKASKETTKPFEKALDILKIEANEVLFVGDRPDRDVLNAKKIGMNTAFAFYGYYGGIIPKNIKKSELNAIKNKYNPNYILYNFKDLIKIIGD